MSINYQMHLMQIMFSLTFALVLGFILFAIIKGIRQWHHNNQQPQLTVEATVVGKRPQVSGSGRNNMQTFTSYYVTFEVESGSRMEFEVPGSEYGLLAEGDLGRLTFQGTRYLGFERY